MIKPSAHLSSITFSGGQKIELGPNEKILLVGPNNSGKSLTFREIVSTAEKGDEKFASNISVKGMDIEKTGTNEDMLSFLDEEGLLQDGNYDVEDWKIDARLVEVWDICSFLSVFTPGFVKSIDAESRLSITKVQQSVPQGRRKPAPQHFMYDDEGLTSRISGLFRRAFGNDLFFDFRGGSAVRIHVGTPPKVEKGEDRVSNSYVEKVRRFPLLHEQGDGVKGYAGILLEAVAMQKDITLIDEPEAFLHPPHMRKLGQTLAEEVSGQLIVATHSSDIMRGFLAGRRGSVRILRMRRSGSKNYVTEESVKTIKTLWQQPNLRYSNALEGIFHEQAIICEGDSDCRLINAVSDHLEQAGNVSLLDTAYIPAGGKHAIYKIATVLRRVGVPVIGIYDIDLLSNGKQVKSAVEGFGGDWEKIQPLWNCVNTAVTKEVKPPTNNQIKGAIIALLNKHTGGNLPKGKIEEHLKSGKSWAVVKKEGVKKIPASAKGAYGALSNELKKIGIVVISKGEIEKFYPGIKNLHGPEFVMKLLKDVKLSDPDLSDLRKFVKMVHKLKLKNLTHPPQKTPANPGITPPVLPPV